jgi:transposase
MTGNKDKVWSYIKKDNRKENMPNKNISVPVAVGIDVAKATLSVCIRSQEGNEKALTLRNIKTDINSKLLPQLQYCTGKIVMESTGHYHWTSALLLKQAGLDIRVVNPLLAKQYTSGNIRKVKTDPADASGLARMAAVADNLPSCFSLSKDRLYLRKKLATLGSMNHQKQALEASLKSLREASLLLEGEETPAIEALEKSIISLKRSLVKLEKECLEETKKKEQEKIKLLSSIPGVSEFCACLCLQWFSFDEKVTAKSWIAFSGLDISSRESGTWRGKCKLTKRGNNFLRRRLYSAAWGAIMNDNNFKTYYNELRKNGRSYVEALVIIARKIVKVMFMILKNGMKYDSTKLFAKKLIAA